MKKIYFTMLALFIIMSSCAQTTLKVKSDVVFQNLLNKAIENSTGVTMTVLSPKFDLNWSGAAGFDSKAKEQKIDALQPFRIASITKTITVVGILRLQEQGKLKIDDAIEGYISEAHKSILQKEGYDLSAITIKHCLQHTSGLFDYAVGNNDFVMKAIEDPTKRWTRTEQIQWAMDHGDKVGEPGKIYHYSDTGYILLGEIIEKLTGKGLAEANRSLIDFEKLELSSTWLESLEPAPKGLGRWVSTYLEDMNATNWDNSVDLYGGGGYFSTTADMAKLYDGLFNGKIFEKPETLELMLSPNGITDQGSTAEAYRMGIWMIRTPYGNGYMHNGFWNAAVIHFPDYNATIALDFVDGYSLDPMKGALKEIVRLSKEE